MSSVNWWTTTSFSGRSARFASAASSHAVVALTSRESTRPITSPGTWPGRIRHSGSSARPTSGSRSQLLQPRRLREEVRAPRLDVEQQQRLRPAGRAQVAVDHRVGLARAVHARRRPRRRWRSPRSARAPGARAARASRTASPAPRAAAPPRAGVPMPERAELRALRRAVVGDDAELRQDAAPAARELGRPACRGSFAAGAAAERSCGGVVSAPRRARRCERHHARPPRQGRDRRRRYMRCVGTCLSYPPSYRGQSRWTTSTSPSPCCSWAPTPSSWPPSSPDRAAAPGPGRRVGPRRASPARGRSSTRSSTSTRIWPRASSASRSPASASARSASRPSTTSSSPCSATTPRSSGIGVASAIAFSIITLLHVVVGELAPKSLAIARTEPVALFVVAPMMRVFYLVTRPRRRPLQRHGQPAAQAVRHPAGPRGRPRARVARTSCARCCARARRAARSSRTSSASPRTCSRSATAGCAR